VKLDVERMRRYQERTALATRVWRLERLELANAQARVRGAHCAACESSPLVADLHRTGNDFLGALRSVFCSLGGIR
jgi:hypothetical protein